jgi:hypothetical protein
MQKFDRNFELLRSQNSNNLRVIIINLDLVIVIKTQFIKEINSSNAYFINV